MQSGKAGCMKLCFVRREITFIREWGFNRKCPDQPVLVSLILMSRPQIPTKSYFTASPKFPYLSGQLQSKVIVPQVVC